jgi:hypothetical protein
MRRLSQAEKIRGAPHQRPHPFFCAQRLVLGSLAGLIDHTVLAYSTAVLVLDGNTGEEPPMAKSRAKFRIALALCACATVFQTSFLPRGCVDYALQTGFAIFDTCAVLNCTDGSFFNLCEPVITLVDCP